MSTAGNGFICDPEIASLRAPKFRSVKVGLDEG